MNWTRHLISVITSFGTNSLKAFFAINYNFTLDAGWIQNYQIRPQDCNTDKQGSKDINPFAFKVQQFLVLCNPTYTVVPINFGRGRRHLSNLIFISC